jgi:hypothetical protein
MMIHVGDEVHLGAGQRFRVVDVVPFDEEDESPIDRLLQVEAAKLRGVTPDSTMNPNASPI